MQEPDFGIYHHSSRKQSEILRDSVRDLFNKAFKQSGISSSRNISVLDAGCGLGFLCDVVASYFLNAVITGVDLFKDGSLKEINMPGAEKNMEILGISERVRFIAADLSKPLHSLGNYDMIVSNLVLHNLGKGRRSALKNLLDIMNPDSFFFYGDLYIGNVSAGRSSENDLPSEVKIISEITLEFLPQYRLQILRKSSPSQSYNK